MSELTGAQVQRKAREIFSKERERFAALLEGTVTAQRVSGDGDSLIEVVPTRCELELRRELDRRTASKDPTLYLVDWLTDGRLPLDIAGRVAQSKVYRIDRDQRLCAAFGCKRMGPDLRRSALAELALEGEIGEFPPASQLTLDAFRAAATWLERELGDEEFSRADFDETRLVLALHGSRGEPVGRRAESSTTWQRWREECAEILARQVSEFAAVMFLAWTVGQTELVRPVLHVLEGLQAGTQGSELTLVCKQLRLRYPLWAERAEQIEVAGGEFLDEWDEKFRTEEPRFDRDVADLVAYIEHPHFFENSPRMAEGLIRRTRDAAHALRSMLSKLDAENDDPWLELQLAFGKLDDHRRLSHEARDEHAMLLRLAAWLWSGRDASKGSGANVVERAITIAQRYAEAGGFVDWARRIAQRIAARADHLANATQELLRAVDTHRDFDDAAFASGMQAWAKAGRPAQGCIPIERASKLLVADFLEQQDSRKLLVLLLDGASWERCRELCADLARRDWLPAAWQPAGSKDPAARPMLAAFPSLTHVSRTAFFAGEFPSPGKPQSTSDDPKRWRQNRHLAKLEDLGTLDLFLRDSVESSTGELQARVRTTVAGDSRLVAVVVNTIDDLLKGPKSHDYKTEVSSIRPLGALLDAARDAGRAVLLVADHGHIVNDRTERIPSDAKEGARWRLDDGSPPHADEVVMTGPGVWSPTAGQDIVMLRGERARYSKEGSRGDHGGLALAEIVSPAILLTTTGLAADDPALQPAPPSEPDWWFASTWRPRGADAQPQPSRSKPKKPRPVAGPLFQDLVEPTPEPATTASPKAPAWRQRLADSAVFKSSLGVAPISKKDHPKVVQQALDLCELLLERNGRAPTAVAARHLGTSLARLDGLLTRPLSVLNADGESCITIDRASNSIVLDRTTLEQVFQVSLEA